MTYPTNDKINTNNTINQSKSRLTLFFSFFTPARNIIETVPPGPSSWASLVLPRKPPGSSATPRGIGRSPLQSVEAELYGVEHPQDSHSLEHLHPQAFRRLAPLLQSREHALQKVRVAEVRGYDGAGGSYDLMRRPYARAGGKRRGGFIRCLSWSFSPLTTLRDRSYSTPNRVVINMQGILLRSYGISHETAGMTSGILITSFCIHQRTQK